MQTQKEKIKIQNTLQIQKNPILLKSENFQNIYFLPKKNAFLLVLLIEKISF